MTRCTRAKANGAQCSRNATTKSGYNHLFCFQHQKTFSLYGGYDGSHEENPLLEEEEQQKTILIQALPNLSQHYTIIKQFAEGGTSIIYLANDQKGNKYAVKIPEDTSAWDMIIDEANLMGILSPYIQKGPFLTSYGLFSHENKPVIVLEYFEGKMLTPEFAKGRIRWIAKQILTGLDILNQNGFNHADIHSGNMLFNGEKLVLLDLSGCLFKPKSIKSQLDCQEPNYAGEIRASPEIWAQIKKEANKSDLLYLWTKKDIFDTGMLLRELVTGLSEPTQNEFNENPSAYQVHLKDKTIERIINLSIDPDPRKRPSAQELLAILKKAPQSSE